MLHWLQESFTFMIQLTETAIGKVQEILDSQEPKPAGLRIAVSAHTAILIGTRMIWEGTLDDVDPSVYFFPLVQIDFSL